MKVLLSLFMSLCTVATVVAQQVGITVVNNSADPTLRLIDVHVKQGGIENTISDLVYQTGRNVSDVAFIFAGLEVEVRVTTAKSVDSMNIRALGSTTFSGEEDDAYVLVLNGLLGSGFVANPDGKPTAPQLHVIKVPLEPRDPVQNTGLFFLHGSTDMNGFDLRVNSVLQQGVRNFSYGSQTSTMIEVKREIAGLQLYEPGTQKLLGGFVVDLSGVTPITVFALTGFKTPGDNNGSNDSLALLGILESGSVVRYPLTSGSQSARVQYIHNMAEPTFGFANVFRNKERVLQNLQYRRGTAYEDFPAGIALQFGIAPNTVQTFGAQVRDTFDLSPLRPSRTYQVFLTGIRDSARYVPNPDSVNVKVDVLIFEGGLERSPGTDSAAIRVIHGVQDAPSLSFATRRRGTLSNRLTYKEASSVYNVNAAGIDTVIVRNLETGTIIASFQMDLRGNNRAVTLLATGFLDPARNNNANPTNYGLRLVLIDANGTATVLSTAVDTLARDTTTVPPDTSDTTSVTWERLVDHNAWSVAPVPASHNVVVTVKAPTFALARFDVVDATGVRRASYTATGSDELSATIQGNLLPSGTYHVVATLPDGRLLGTTSIVIAR
jgi:hypothetical protein